MNCINCNTIIEAKYCPNCGEKGNVPRITFSNILSNVFTSFTNMDKGIFYNIKNLTIAPQSVVTQYIKGQRRYVFNPINYAILTITLYILIENYFKIPLDTLVKEVDENRSIFYQAGKRVGKLIDQDLKYFWLLNIFYLSIFTKFFFGRFNYAEHLAANAFIVGHVTLVGLVLFPFLSLPISLNPFVGLAAIIMILCTFKGKKGNLESLIFSFFSISFSYILGLILALVIVLLFF